MRGARAGGVLASLACLLLGVAGGPAAAQTILNVERPESPDESGVWGAVDASGSLAVGNTDVLQVKGGLLVGYRAAAHAVRVYAGGELLRGSGSDVLKNGYAHLRYNHALGPRWRTFHFVQLQSNQNLLLERRLLVGSGIRARARSGERATLDLGTGLMLEDERLDASRLSPTDEARTRTARVSNLLVFSLRIREGVRLVEVAYLQPRLSDPGDLRLLNDLALLVALARRANLTVTAEWRHDSRPPAGIEAHDLRLSTGLTFALP
jgi:hypothetical protein